MTEFQRPGEHIADAMVRNFPNFAGPGAWRLPSGAVAEVPEQSPVAGWRLLFPISRGQSNDHCVPAAWGCGRLPWSRSYPARHIMAARLR